MLLFELPSPKGYEILIPGTWELWPYLETGSLQTQLVKIRSYWIKWALNSIWLVPLEEKTQARTLGEKPHNYGDQPGLLATTGSREKARRDPSLEVHRGAWPCHRLDFTRSASRTVSECISIVLSYSETLPHSTDIFKLLHSATLFSNTNLQGKPVRYWKTFWLVWETEAWTGNRAPSSLFPCSVGAGELWEWERTPDTAQAPWSTAWHERLARKAKPRPPLDLKISSSSFPPPPDPPFPTSSTNQKERPQGEPTLWTPWSWTSSHQNCEKISSCYWILLFGILRGMPQLTNTAGIHRAHVNLLSVLPHQALCQATYTNHTGLIRDAPPFSMLTSLKWGCIWQPSPTVFIEWHDDMVVAVCAHACWQFLVHKGEPYISANKLFIDIAS